MQHLNYKDYQGSIEVSLEDNCLHGQVMFITDLVVFEGKTIEELRSSFESAVDGYIAYCQETNQEPCRPFKGSFNVRISPELHKRLAEYAAKHDKTQNEIVKEAISEKLGEGQREVARRRDVISSEVTFSEMHESLDILEMLDTGGYFSSGSARFTKSGTKSVELVLPVEHIMQ